MNGSSPVSIAYSTTPADQISAAGPLFTQSALDLPLAWLSYEHTTCGAAAYKDGAPGTTVFSANLHNTMPCEL